MCNCIVFLGSLRSHEVRAICNFSQFFYQETSGLSGPGRKDLDGFCLPIPAMLHCHKDNGHRQAAKSEREQWDTSTLRGGNL